MTDNITLPRETVSQLTRLFTDMQLSRLPSLWQVSTLLNILTAALKQQADLVCPECKAAVLYECVACSSNNYPPQQQAEPVHGDIRALKYRIHELEGEVMGYKRMLDVAEAASQPQQQAEPVAWGCNRYIEDDNGFQIGTVDPELAWGKYAPDDNGWWPLYTTPPQRKPLTDELEAAFKDGWQSAKAAHGIKEGT